MIIEHVHSCMLMKKKENHQQHRASLFMRSLDFFEGLETCSILTH